MDLLDRLGQLQQKEGVADNVAGSFRTQLHPPHSNLEKWMDPQVG
jgi:hypothetical protein